MDTSTLTPKQRLFVSEYLVDLNATQAYIRAGYAVKHDSVAMVSSSRLLSNVKVAAAIAEAQQHRAVRTNITADKVLAELAALGFTNMADYAAWGEDGVRLRPSSELTRAQTAAVLEVTELRNSKGQVSGVRFKLADKEGALDKIARHLGMYPKEGAGGDVNIYGPVQFVFAKPVYDAI